MKVKNNGTCMLIAGDGHRQGKKYHLGTQLMPGREVDSADIEPARRKAFEAWARRAKAKGRKVVIVEDDSQGKRRGREG